MYNELQTRIKNIESLIDKSKTKYVRFGNKTTVCYMVTYFGFEFIGKAFCADVQNFSPEIGEKTAYEDAFKQIEECLLFTEAFNKYASEFEKQ